MKLSLIMSCFTLAKFGIFCSVIVLLSTQATGVILKKDGTQPVTKLLFSAFDALTFCLRPFKIIGCDDQSEWYDDQSDFYDEDDLLLERKTMAFLFTRKNPRHPEFLHLCGGHLPKNTNFNSKHKTEIFIHGWLDGICRTKWLMEMKKELLKRGSFNVILIDWTWGNGPEYYTGAKNVYVVRRHLASLIKNIMIDSGVGPENFHLVGHSFGAQITGLAGKMVPNLRRITALDPALVPFQDKPASERLNATDAKLVDVIHSNGGMTAGVTLGDIQPLGDADFYPNGGTMQESCVPYTVKSLTKLDLLYGLFNALPIFCNHLQSIQYYKVSINPTECEFIGVTCKDYESFKSGRCSSCGKRRSKCAVMGMDFEYRKHPSPNKQRYRKYYLSTTLLEPYCDN